MAGFWRRTAGATGSQTDVPWGPLSLALTLLAIEAASLVLFGMLVRHWPDVPAWLEKNQIAPAARHEVFGAMVLGAIAAFAVGLGALAKGRERATPRVLGVARGLAFVVPIAILPALFSAELWTHQRLPLLAILAAYGFALERAIRYSLEAKAGWAFVFERTPSRVVGWLSQPRVPLVLVVVLAAAYAAYTAHMTILNHHRIGTGSYNLALEDNIVFNFLHGQGYRSSVMFGARGGSALADHARFTMVAFLPFYALLPRAETLLVLQAMLLGFAAVPLYLFACTQVSRWLALFVAAAYLLFAPMHTAQFYDFHWLPPAVFFYFLLFFAIATRRRWLAIATLPLLLGMREDVAPDVIFLGLFLLFSDERPALGAWIVGVCTSVFVLVKFVVMPWAGTWSLVSYYQDLIPEGGSGYGSVVATIVANPVYALLTMLKEAKLEYFLHIAAPLVFLPLRRFALGWIFAPAVFFTLLATRGPCYSLGYQYVMHWVPFLFAGLAIALRGLPNEAGARKRPAAVLAVATVMLVHSTAFGVVIRPSSFVSAAKKFTSYGLTDEEKKTYDDLRGLVRMIPPTASVTATDFAAPHLSNRLSIYTIGQDDSAGEYLLIDTRSLHLARSWQNLETIWRGHSYGLVAKASAYFYLFQQGRVSDGTADAAREIGIH